MISELDKKIIRQMQGCLPLDTLEPFAAVAARLEISEGELIERVNRMQRDGIIRRVGAVLYHQSVGKTHNVMTVWRVPGEQLEALATELCRRPEVSHCYERETAATWPYNLYAMMHCESAQQAQCIARHIAEITGVEEYRLLTSTREFKKASPIYF